MSPELTALFLIGLGLKNFMETTPNVDKTLRFNENHEFTILQFTDLHYGEESEKDENNMKLQQKLIEWVKPDLTVLTGDMISGYGWDGK